MRSAFVLIALLALAACSDPYPYLSPLAKKSYDVYRVHCTLCHADPHAGAPTGPPVAGSSRELLIAKTLERRYPDGYKPKRPGQITMPEQPQVKSHIDELVAFLAEVKPR